MTDAKSEYFELDLTPDQRILAILRDAMDEIRKHKHAGGDNPMSATYLRRARNRLSDAREALAKYMHDCGMREDV